MIDIVKAKTDTINKIANDRSKRQTNNSVHLDCHHHQNKKLKVDDKVIGIHPILQQTIFLTNAKFGFGSEVFSP